MKKTSWISLISGLTIIIGVLFFVGSSKVFASTNFSSVDISYTLYNNLSEKEQKMVVQGEPDFKLLHDNESFKLVYEQVQPLTEKGVDHVSPLVTKAQKVTSSLPKTGSSNNKIIGIFGVLLLIVVSALFFWKRKKIKTMLILTMLLGGFGFTTVANASQTILPFHKNIQQSKGQSVGKIVQNFPGYRYLGYIHTYNDIAEKPLNSGTVTVKYQDSSGNTLADDLIISGNIGESFESKQKEFAGYSLKEVKGNPIGKFTAGSQTIIYVYNKQILTSSIVVKYQDSSGNILADEVKLVGKVGDSYTAEQKKIAGYTFKEVQGKTSGIFQNDSEIITFIYEKNVEEGVITLEKSGFINATNRGYIAPEFYKVTYYDAEGNVLKKEEIKQDTTLVNDEIKVKVGENYTVYSKVTYECYSLSTGERLEWGDYELVANDPLLTKGVMNNPTLVIKYTFNDLSWA